MVVHETYKTKDGAWAAPAEIRIEGIDDARKAYLLTTGEEVAIGGIEKMSKSKRNTVDPDDIMETYGADTARWFMLSDSPPERDVNWTEDRVQGAGRFVRRVWRFACDINELLDAAKSPPATRSDKATNIRKIAHKALAAYSDNVEALRFNVCVAQVYDMMNQLEAELKDATQDGKAKPDADIASALVEAASILVALIAPMMPHLAEECWVALGNKGLASQAPWPEVEAALLVENTITLPVQVNGKKRADVTVARDAATSDIEAAVLALDAVQKALEGKKPKKVIVVPQRIVNVVA
jgi:leucyl-tRNA synthetase